MSDGFCLEGNCGFPVVVNGLSSVTIPQQPNDITLQFNKNSTISFNNATQIIEVSDPSYHSFFIGGNQYVLRMIRICQATPNGLDPYQGYLPQHDLKFLGVPPASTINNGRVAVLIIPIYGNTSMNIYATNLMDLLQGNNKDISKVFPDNAKVIRYETCIEYGDTPYKNTKIVVAYWQTGMNFSFPIKREDFLPNGIPLHLTNNQYTYSAFTQTGSQGRKTFARTDQIADTVSSVPYTTNVTASTTDFSKRFAQMTYSTAITTAKKRPQQLKCKAIDRSKDIKDGLLIVDPSTGELLTDTDADQAAKDAQFAAIPPSTITGGDIQRTMAIVLGTIGGTILLALAVLFIMHFTAGETDAEKAAAIAAAAAEAAKPAIQWVDLLLPTFLGLCLFGIITVVTVSLIMSYS